MKYDYVNHNVTTKRGSKPAKHQKKSLRPILMLGLLVCCAGFAFAVRAYNSTTRKPVTSALLPPAARPGRGNPQPGALSHRNLSLQPEAERMSRRLGQRFLAPGYEKAVMIGALDIGSEHHQVQITRNQETDGESVAIALDGGQPALTWNNAEGARSAGAPVNANQRALVERLVLDSPDQFVLAQLRGASYRTVARNVVPKGAADLEDYSGPVWDVILISEPVSSADNEPLSDSRLYYINTTTQLLDRVVSQADGQTVVAEFSGWVDKDGEKLPTHIAWRQNERPVMELNLTGATHGLRR